MVNDCTLKIDNVVLVDPNCVNVDGNMVNNIPQYQDMHIFADLIATRRGRTILFEGGTGRSEEGVRINLMGFNQDENDPNYGKFTTNYYEDSRGVGNKVYESFGIKHIKATINSSFIPQVNIQFLDIRGLSFFNQGSDKETSPYRILFDFPPPVFELTIKGYYGRALRYKLHLVNYTTEFDSNNGNFVIDANFVAMTFAPLTDILFRYVVNFPLMEGGEFNPDLKQPPRNTYELSLKVKRLLAEIEDFNRDNTDKQNYDKVVDRISNVSSLMTFFNGIKESPTLNERGFEPILFVKNPAEEVPSPLIITGLDNGSIVQIDNVGQYDSLIQQKQVVGAPESMESRLLIGFFVGEVELSVEEVVDENEEPEFNTFFGNFPTFDDTRVGSFKNVLNRYRTELIDRARNDIGGADFNNQIRTADVLDSRYDFDGYLENKVARFVYIDLTDFYLNLYKLDVKLNDDKIDLANKLNAEINQIVFDALGIIPTIYNIFEIILNDVDKFFNIMRSVSNEAENNHHNLPGIKERILGGNFADVGSLGSGDIEGTKIYSFPLVIRNKRLCGKVVEERIAPIDISNAIAERFSPFPEMLLIENFINTFRRQANLAVQFFMLDQQNADGSYVWIPLSPFDSRLYLTTTTTPYFGIDSSNAGTESRPIPVGEDNRLHAIFKILMARFYVLSQYVYPTKFTSNVKEDVELMKLHAEAEAMNLAVSIFNENLRNNLRTVAEEYKANPIAFFQYIQANIPELFNGVGTDETNEYVNLNMPVYVNKNDEANYRGCSLHRTLDLVEVETGEATKNPIDRFRQEVKVNWFNKVFRGKPSTESLSYVQENLFHFRDGFDRDGGRRENLILKSRFCARHFEFTGNRFQQTILFQGPINKANIIENVVKLTNNRYGGNDYVRTYAGIAAYELNKDAFFQQNLSGDVVKAWSTELFNETLTDIYDKIFNVNNPDTFNPKLSAILILSNLGYTLSPFNRFPFELNETIFNTPAVINLPRFAPAYIGALADIEIGDEVYNELYEFFVNGDGKSIKNFGILIFADIVDIKQKLSHNDRELFRREFSNFFGGSLYDEFGGSLSSEFGSVVTNFRLAFDEYIKRISPNNYNEELLNEILNSDRYFNRTFGRLLRDGYLLTFSDLTFKHNDLTEETYVPVGVTQNASQLRFSQIFFDKLISEIDKIIEDDRDDEKERKRIMEDEDIITQTYYSFKNINDKWVSQPIQSNVTGYTFNEPNGRLIDLFAFVDRGMNPIGDTIINPEALAELVEDTDVSVFGVISQLLSNNGFEFFPLQNFMNIEYGNEDSRDAWTESFMINTSGQAKTSANFVCMYIGGSSRMITGIEEFGNFKDDGITDLSSPEIGYFSADDCVPQDFEDRDRQLLTNPNFPWRQVRAFRVRFAEQNQSMFRDFKVESKEFPETNESLQILSRLAGDHGGSAPIPKGQNLYNLYENRAYSATVTGLGNAMIQPTQYFQLENVPLYNGAYLILNVEHDIEANKMTTTFSGTKILKYPIPRVTNPATIFGFDGGDTDITSASRSSRRSVITGVGAAGNPREAKYNSMYTQNVNK